MAAQSQTTVKALGLNINPNFLDLPNGSLVVANDVIIKRENVIESRRGLSDWSEGLGISTDRANQLIEYKDRILANYSNKLAFDTGALDSNDLELFSDFAGTYSSPSAYRMRSIEANKNLYFTTSNGIKKISAVTADDFSTASGYIQDAGAVKAIDFTTTLQVEQGQTDGFLPVDAAVAYRIVWGYKDANDNLILGSPSARNLVYNFANSAFVLDYNKLLTILDIFGSTTGQTLISDTDYYSTLALSGNPSGIQMKANLTSLASKLDTDILLGDVGAAAAPLDIDTIEMNLAGIVTLTFTGTVTNYISVGDYVNLTGLTSAPTPTTDLTIFNGVHQVTSVTATTITFPYTFVTNQTPYDIASTPVDATTILNSYNYTHIIESGNGNEFPVSLNDVSIDTPITAGQQATITDSLSRIITRLGSELNAVIASTLIADYITPFNITESGNVRLQISIPTDSQGAQLNSAYFMQVYRSNVFQAFNGSQFDSLQLGITVIPDDELHLVYEYFPTTSDFANGYVLFDDSFPDSLAQTNTPLYTNPVTGDGILQSNDIPPYAADINYFKNVTFYANTKTRHLISNLQLIGVDGITSGDKVTIANEDTSSTYTFIDGVQEVTQFTIGTVAAINSTQFFLNSAGDFNRYYFWYDVDQTGVDPLGKTNITSVGTGASPIITTTTSHGLKSTDSITIVGSTTTPNIDGTHIVTVTGATTFTITPENPITVGSGAAGTVVLNGILGVPIPVLSTDAIADACERSANVINNVIYDFTAAFGATTFTVTNVDAGITTNAVNSTVPTFTVLVTTSGTGEDVDNGIVQVARTLSAAQNIDLTARSFIRVINGNTDSPVYAYYTSGDNTSPGQIALESKVLSDTPFYVIASSPQFNSGTLGIGNSFTPDISPINVVTGSTIVNGPVGYVTFNTVVAHGLQNGFQIVITNTNSNPIVDGVYTVYNVTTTTFDIEHTPVLVGPGTTFSWELTSDSVVSNNSVKPNRVYYSKFNQPDAVPILNYFDIGPEDDEILRIFPLRTTLFVLKEDGVYRISGEIAPFSVQLFDNSCILIAPDTVDVTDNTIFCWTTKGITTITESGTEEISTPVDVEILKLASYPNFKTLTWGVGYNSDYSYTVFTNDLPTDEVATIGFRYSTLTKTWTNIVRTQVSGLIRSTDDKLYMGSGDDNIINKERKNFDRTDYADRDFELNIAANLVNSTGTEIQFSSVASIDVGDVLYQDQYLTIYKFNALLEKLDLDPTVSDNDYFDTLEASIGDNMRDKILALAAKLDSDPGLTFTTYLDHIEDKTRVITGNSLADPTVVTTSAVSELVDGRIITISGTQTPESIPSIVGQYQISDTGTWGVSSTFTIPVDVTTNGGTGLSLTTNSNDFLDIQACYNVMIVMLNNDPGATFTDYTQVEVDTPMEAVVIYVDRVNRKVTLNLGLQWIVGSIQCYKAIPCEVIYAPLTFGDVLKLKQVFEATAMFSNTAFTDSTMSFSSDLKPDFISVHFNNYGNGIFGSYSNPGFGFGYFGGGGNAKPFRTLIPRQAQRCRFINIKFEHTVAREIISLYGVTLTANIGQSTRAYR